MYHAPADVINTLLIHLLHMYILFIHQQHDFIQGKMVYNIETFVVTDRAKQGELYCRSYTRFNRYIRDYKIIKRQKRSVQAFVAGVVGAIGPQEGCVIVLPGPRGSIMIRYQMVQ